MRTRWLLLLAGAYALALALIALWPTPVDRGVSVSTLAPVRWLADVLDLKPWEAYNLVEASANVVLFVPLGALVLLWFSGARWWHAVAIAFATTVTIELLQQALRPDRFATLSDVIANTLGGAIGALLVVATRAVRPSRTQVVGEHRGG